MSEELSTKNPFYSYKIIDNSSDFLKDKNSNNDLVVSFYIFNGELNLKFKGNLLIN